MKTKILLIIMVQLGIAWFTSSVGVLAQGSLTPPGAPAATMKTLEQVEPRTPLSVPESSTGNLQISKPGAYYLTTNLVFSNWGIAIESSDVTLDLNGFYITAGNAGISIGGQSYTNILIHSGTIRGCGRDAVQAYDAHHCTYRNLRIIDNTVAGLLLGDSSIVENCFIANNKGNGVICLSNSKIINNTIMNNSGVGMQIFWYDSYIKDNSIINNGIGIQTYEDTFMNVYSRNNIIEDNVVKGNSNNYDFVVGNQLNILLCEIPETLDWPCSVKLAGSLICTNTAANGITVNADNVTIDMAGHTLTGPGAAGGNGIYQSSAYLNLKIFNGKVENWKGPGSAGVYANGFSTILSDLQVSKNTLGLFAGKGSTITACTAYNNDSSGISADDGSTLNTCAAYDNGNIGIELKNGCTIRNGTSHNNTGNGISAGNGSAIIECISRNNTAKGITVVTQSTIKDCTVSHNKNDGIQVAGYCTVMNNNCDYNRGAADGAGIHATSSRNRIADNSVTDNDHGIKVDTAGNFIIRNSAGNNASDYSITGTQTIGPIITAIGTITNSNPWANFSF